MAFKIAVDAGHGLYTAGKRTPDGDREWSFNNTVVLAGIERLKQYEDVAILRVDDPTGKTDIPLSTRAQRANKWGADVYWSAHHNANTGVWGDWTGVETFVYTNASANSRKLANAVQPRYVEAMGLRDRGVKSANFAVLRETTMPAILTEGGYMDSRIDIVKLRNDAILRKAGEAVADGIAAYAGLKRKAEVKTAATPNTKEESRMFAPSTKTLENEMIQTLEMAHKNGILSSDQWAKQAREGTLTIDNAVALMATIIRRTNVEK